MKRLLLLLFLLLTARTLSADFAGYCSNAVPPCFSDDPKSACYVPPEPNPVCEPADCDKCTKSPCYAATGVYVQSATDLQIDTTGLPIVVERHYQSSQGIDGDVGYGWLSSLSAHLTYSTYFKAAPATYQKEADVRLPTGALYRFVDNGDGTFRPPLGRFDSLVQNADGSFDLRIQRSRTVLHFDGTGKLVTMTDPFGNTQTWTYSGDRLARIADSTGSGRFVDVTWGADGRISDIVDVAARAVHYAYDSRGVLVGATNPLSQTMQYSYTAGRFAPMLTSITDPWGRTVATIAYDPQSRTHSYTENGETYTYTYAYQNNSLQTAKTDSAGNVWKFVYTADGLVTESWAPGATAPLKTTYDANGLLVSKVDQVGVRTSATYNADGNPLSATLDEGGPGAVRFDYAYDANYPEKLVSVSPYDPATNQRNRNWQALKFDYYPPGSVAPGALYHVYDVDDDGVTGRATITYTYDAHGRVVSAADTAGNAMSYVYDSQGNLTSVSSPPNNDAGIRPQTTFTYDVLGRRTSSADPDGRSTAYTLDALGRIKTITLSKPSAGSPLDFTSSFFYDEYDPGTQLLFTRMIDPQGRTSKIATDAYGFDVQTVGIAGDIVRSQFTRGLLTSQWDADGNQTTYAYDALRRLIKITYPDTTFVAYSYNWDDTIASRRSRKGQTITFTYDHFKRLATKTYPNGTAVTNSYAGQKLQQVTDTHASPGELHTFLWDSSFRLIQNAQANRGTVRYTYGADRRLATREVVGGAVTTLEYYPDASLRSLGWSPVSGTFHYDYDLSGRLQKIAFPNGQTREYSYDGQGRLTQLANRHPAAGDLAVFAYGYDVDPASGLPTSLGNRTTVTTTMPSLSIAGTVAAFAYDNRDFLSAASYPATAAYAGLSESWSYDGEGNRLQSVINGAVSNYAYQLTRMTSDGANAYTFDANGNVTARSGPRGNVTFGYDEEDRLRTISGDTTASYTYDYLFRRTGKTAGAATSTYLYDDVHAIAESAGGATTEYLFGPGYDQALAMVRGGAVRYFDTDVVGSVVAVNDTGGSVLNSYVRDAWGVPLATNETVPNSLTYTGRETGEAGFQYSRYRSYEPATGRFSGEDPDGAVGELNPYLYAWASPLLFNDPMGLHVQVCYFPTAAHGFGHVGFSTSMTNNTKSWGFGATSWNKFGGPGDVTRDYMHREHYCKWIETSPDQDRCMETCAVERHQNPGYFNGFTRQCTSFTRDCMQKCGIPHGDYDGPYPSLFYLGLPNKR
jgi:RHS repeat-associated protein